MLSSGTDLRELAETAAANGADVIGMAGGDGSQATVASVAADHDLGFGVRPATGTRNHLALDLGVDRRDVVGALDAFGAARESRMDLGTVNGRVFVNNVSLGIYAEIVASEAYRDNKVRTVSNALPDLLGPGAPRFDLHVSAPDGTITDVHLVQVSNRPVRGWRLGAIGLRPLDSGRLGVIVLRLGGPDAAAFIALEAAGRADRFPGWRAWTAQELRVDSSSAVAAGLDGEAVELEPPLPCCPGPRPSAVELLSTTPACHPLRDVPASVDPR